MKDFYGCRVCDGEAEYAPRKGGWTSCRQHREEEDLPIEGMALYQSGSYLAAYPQARVVEFLSKCTVTVREVAVEELRATHLAARRALDDAERSLRREHWKITRIGDWERKASRPEIEFEFAVGEDWEAKRDEAILAMMILCRAGGEKC